MILAEAFMRDPVSEWIFPDEEHRAKSHPAFFGEFVNLVLEAGEIYLAGEGAGVTLWLPVDGSDEPDEGQELLQTLEAAVGAEATKRFAVLDGLMAANHPSEPHWYLPFIAVHPDQHSKGVGSALLRHKLTQLDEAGSAAYLEASSPRNATLYERHGFGFGPSILDLPDGPSLYPMWRNPARPVRG
ncbi:Acetyltransferase (GNAT) domain-containing protein [Micromonospora viridifaciens]|uniref:Acetyltransferase (GNAT) domain-containing protein n=1 Tax=Micromonospora viridifaciens TaxID=1881 RepID=A0A1C4XH05_MICVI|nr:GNAT family N-acetyltransferase [Micromonospora viridifaciens]SCF07704.1 Acetyltransferase (GNAT) domain-containing protein [Micromonospora viridifaciens]